jgi:16S rRNA (guanine(966)-N(2))-methyltransferase RsmD
VRKNFPSRPTTDFAKESLFNILNNHFDFNGLQVLDLFAGTGSISYEFASRGSNVELVESEYRSFKFIHKTITELGLTTIKPHKVDVFRIIDRLNCKYDLIFADPPYTLDKIDEIPDIIFSHQLLKEGGWFILEHSGNHVYSSHRNFRELRKYGSVHFTVFTEKTAGE